MLFWDDFGRPPLLTRLERFSVHLTVPPPCRNRAVPFLLLFLISLLLVLHFGEVLDAAAKLPPDCAVNLTAPTPTSVDVKLKG